MGFGLKIPTSLEMLFTEVIGVNRLDLVEPKCLWTIYSHKIQLRLARG